MSFSSSSHFFFDTEAYIDFDAPRSTTTVDCAYECMLLLGRWMFTEIWQHMRLLPFFSKGWVINWSTSGHPALRLYSDWYRYCYFVLGCGWGRIFHFPFSASLFVCMNMRHAEYRPARRPLLYIFYVCWSSLFSATSLGGSGPTLSTYNRISAAIFLVAMNLHSNIFQPSLGWQWTYNRILFSHLFGGIVESVRWQSELCNIHISLVAHLSIWLVAQNFQCPRNFCFFCGSIFRHRQATLLTLISLKRETRKSKDLQHVVTFSQTKTCSIF